ncbi:MAG: Large-conductance mechanosensitive ion channel [Candidatus Thorarchaeota archaeon]|nr:MAG: Large-conductance mechanosensitive ion channel [Candidatus Thorarchaeota archaeon]
MSTEEVMLEELREIRKLLTPTPPPPPPEGVKDEFLTFLKKYQVLGLAVAFIMGIYLGQLVQSLVNNLIMPLVSIALNALGGGEPVLWENIAIGPFTIGLFFADLITFIIIAIVIFLIVKFANRVGIK